MKNEFININDEFVEELLFKKKLNGTEFSRLLGYDKGWWSTHKRQKTKVPSNIVYTMAYILGTNEDNLIASEEEEKPREVNEEASALLEESDFEKEVREALNYTLNYLKEISEICLKLDKQQSEKKKSMFEVSLPKVGKTESQVFVPEIDRATALLDKMLENVGGIKYEDYRAELKRREHIEDGRMLEAAISKRGYSKMSRGYGRNKVLWIVKPSAVQSLQK